MTIDNQEKQGLNRFLDPLETKTAAIIAQTEVKMFEIQSVAKFVMELDVVGYIEAAEKDMTFTPLLDPSLYLQAGKNLGSWLETAKILNKARNDLEKILT